MGSGSFKRHLRWFARVKKKWQMIRMKFQPQPLTLRLSGLFEKRDFTGLLFGVLGSFVVRNNNMHRRAFFQHTITSTFESA